MKKIDFSKSTDKLLTTIDKIGKLSKLYRILIFLGICLVLVGPFVYFSCLPKMEKISKLEEEYQNTQNKLVTSRAKANQLKRYEAKMKKAKSEFTVVVKKLPEKKEIPSLLASISQSGQSAGLDFLLFKPKPEVKKDFYAQIPVSIRVSGNYHNVALFFDKVSRLSRIVNIFNVSMSAPKKGKGDKLLTSCTAVTYRFVEKKKKKKKKKKK